jgi:hypothetical protein
MANSLPSVEQLKRAIDLKSRIAKLEAELGKLFGGKARSAVKRRSGMSAAGRARIAAAARLRWAKIKAKNASPSRPAVRKAKRRMSADQKAKLRAVAKARWAKVKAEGKKTL